MCDGQAGDCMDKDFSECGFCTASAPPPRVQMCWFGEESGGLHVGSGCEWRSDRQSIIVATKRYTRAKRRTAPRCFCIP